MSSTGDLDGSSRRSFDEFVTHSRLRLRQVVTRVLGPHLVGDVDADDLVQIAHERVLKRWEKFENEVAAYAYAERIVRNRAKNAHRDAARRSGAWLQVVHHEQARQAPAPDEWVLPVLGLRAALSAPGLTDEQRRAVVLVDVEDLPADEAAAVLGTTPGSLKGLLQRGRKRLRDDWPTLTPGLVALLPRWRRPGLATAACTAPAVLVVALSLTVLNMPFSAEAGTPRGRSHVVPPPAWSAPVPAQSHAGLVSAPRTTDTPAPMAGPPFSPTPSPLPSPSLSAPGGGACVGDTCAGEQLGDRVCARTGQQDFDPACANQDFLGVCPVLPQTEHTTCTRDTDPMVDVTPPP